MCWPSGAQVGARPLPTIRCALSPVGRHDPDRRRAADLARERDQAPVRRPRRVGVLNCAATRAAGRQRRRRAECRRDGHDLRRAGPERAGRTSKRDAAAVGGERRVVVAAPRGLGGQRADASGRKRFDEDLARRRVTAAGRRRGGVREPVALRAPRRVDELLAAAADREHPNTGAIGADEHDGAVARRDADRERRLVRLGGGERHRDRRKANRRHARQRRHARVPLQPSCHRLMIAGRPAARATRGDQM